MPIEYLHSSYHTLKKMKESKKLRVRKGVKLIRLENQKKLNELRFDRKEARLSILLSIIIYQKKLIKTKSLCVGRTFTIQH